MKRIMPFLLLLFVTFSCSNSMLDSTDISIGVDLSELNLNYTSLDNLENNSKFKVSLYEVEKPEQVPVDYKSVDKSLYKMLASSYSSINDTKQASVVLNDIPVGINAFIIAEVFENDVDSSNVLYAGISKVFEVLPEKNIVDLELESCVIDEPVFTLEYKTQTEIVISTQKNIKAGTSIPLPQNINLNELGIKGFGNFLGFYTDSLFTGNPITSVVVDKDITLYAKFEIIDYSITYVIDGATWKNYTPNSSYNVLNAAISYIPEGRYLEKVGYTFEGWYKDADYKEEFTSFVGLFEAITLYAKWTPILYNITYELAGGDWKDSYSENQKYTVEDASDTILPDSTWISRDGFVFEGWYDNAEYTGTAIKNLAGRTGNITFYARWRDANQVATVQFSEPAGGVDASTNITLTCATENATIYYSYEGKEFNKDSWQNNAWHMYQSDAATSEGITIFANGSTNPVTIYAIAVCDRMENSAVATIEYTLNEYTVHLDANGGTLNTSVTFPITVKSGNTVSLSGYTATRTGYTFKGWYEDKNPDFTNSGEVRDFTPSRDNAPNKTKTFYAGWEPITYTVVFDGNGADASSSMASQNFKYDESKALSQNTFVRTGYTFNGWNIVQNPTEANLGVSYNDKELVKNLTTTSGRITLYAQWEANKATITVTMPEYTDISELEKPTENNNGSLTFKAPESPADGVTYEHNIWYVNGKEKQQNTGSTNEWTFDTTNLSGGIYTIMLVVVDSNGNKYSAEYQVTVTK